MYGGSPPQGPPPAGGPQYGYRQGPLPEQPRMMWWPRIVAWCTLALGVLLLAGTAVAAYGSESDGIVMSYVAVGPFFFGLVATIAGQVTRYRKPAAHAGATFGCGCASALFATIALFVFFAVIWRML